MHGGRGAEQEPGQHAGVAMSEEFSWRAWGRGQQEETQRELPTAQPGATNRSSHVYCHAPQLRLPPRARTRRGTTRPPLVRAPSVVETAFEPPRTGCLPLQTIRTPLRRTHLADETTRKPLRGGFWMVYRARCLHRGRFSRAFWVAGAALFAFDAPGAVVRGASGGSRRRASIVGRDSDRGTEGRTHARCVERVAMKRVVRRATRRAGRRGIATSERTPAWGRTETRT
jgi:hypothetical protein